MQSLAHILHNAVIWTNVGNQYIMSNNLSSLSYSAIALRCKDWFICHF